MKNQINKHHIRSFFVILLSILSITGKTQEKLVPLTTNFSYYYGDLSPQEKQNAPVDKAKPTSLFLPFRDDFSYCYQNKYPNRTLWRDSTVYINSGFAIAPPSLGVATFDGLNQHGYPYLNPTVPNLILSAPADTLQSNDINLFTSILGQTLTPNDNIGLSFYYQARGYGEAPEQIDSLVLELYKPKQNTWKMVWSSRGITNANVVDTTFKRVFIWLKDTSYLYDGFKFRFRNKATTSGNFDHWNVDYVYLNTNRDSIADTLYNDVTFAYVPRSFLKDYNAMPWQQYEPSEMATSNWVAMKNNYKDPINIYYENYFFNKASQQTYSYSAQANNIPPFKGNGYYSNPAFSNPAGHPTFTYDYPLMTERQDFRIKHLLYRSGANNDFIPQNDSVIQIQSFQNYFALDDGSPEQGYFVYAPAGKMAMKFRLNKQDTLRALRIYFDPAPIASADKYYFKILIYSGVNGPANIITIKDSTYYPRFDKTGFKEIPEFKLAEPLVLGPGTYFAGIQQQLSTGLVVGIDVNTPRDGSLFYDSGTGWTQSSIRGAIMIRPVFGSKQTYALGVQQQKQPPRTYRVYPNPSQGSFIIHTEGDVDGEYMLLNSLGQLVQQGEYKNGHLIETPTLENGLYLLQVSSNGAVLHQSKIIIQKH